MSIYSTPTETVLKTTKLTAAKLNEYWKEKLDDIDAQFLPGELKQTARSSAPAGWLLCQGQAISRTTYAALFAAIDTKYGAGDGSTTFNIPNMKGRVPIGLDPADGDFDDRGKSGGEKTHTLVTGEMPSHAHPGVGNHRHFITGDGAYAHQPYSCPGDKGGGSQYTDYAGAHSHPAVGGGGAHNNLQPYLVMNWLIKT